MKYKFILKHDPDREVFPIYKDDLSIDYEKQSEEMFYRAKINGTMTFLREDYNAIMAKPFDYVHTMEIHKQNREGGEYTLYHVCKFMRTDCEIDADNRILSVKPEIVDEYTDVLAGMEKEYNLAELAIETASLQLDKRPLLQLYVPDTNIISCYLSGMSWEQDALITPDERDLKNIYHFSLSTILKEVKLTNAGNADGLYVGRMQDIEDLNKFSGRLYSQENTAYYIYMSQQMTEQYDEQGYHYLWEVLVEVRNVMTDVAIYRYSASAENPKPFDTLEYELDNLSGGESANADQKSYNIYARFLLDKESIFGLPTQAIPADDIAPDNRNYRRVVGYKLNIAYISSRFSDEPTEYGRTDDGRYFLPPISAYGQKFYPLGQSTWRYASLWFAYQGIEDLLIEREGRKSYTLRDTYTIGGVIKALLAQFAPNITHEETEEYSQFLYGQVNPVSSDNFRLLVTQKSNLLIGEYQDPASQVPATLQDFTLMLRKALKCYWYIEDGKFKIEHISFFERGGKYIGSPEIGYNLTTLMARNGKSWAYQTGKYTFNKEQLPERYQFDWMDNVTAPFKGNAIEVVSNYVQKGKIEDVNIANFTSDIDYILLNPADISKDGFALFAGQPADGIQPQGDFGAITASGIVRLMPNFNTINDAVGRGVLEYIATGAPTINIEYYFNEDEAVEGEALIADGTRRKIEINIPAGTIMIGFSASGSVEESRVTPYSLKVANRQTLGYKQISLDGVEYELQNGLLSMFYIQPTFWRYDLPSHTARINGNDMQARSIKKAKTQDITFPVGFNDPDPLKLVKTSLGNGTIETISINLASRSGKAKLNYATE